jgi:uracil-DNA glycosylase
MDLDFQSLDAQIRACTRCEAVLAKSPENPPDNRTPVRPRPVLSVPFRAPIMLLGQAPGLEEYRTRKPFSGGAGHGVRDLFVSCGLPRANFDAAVYQTSVVKCYPGRKENNGQWEDRVPCAAMKRNCETFLFRQIKAVSPRLIVTLGAFAAKELDRLRGKRCRRTLEEMVGLIEDWEGIRIIFLPHTSGKNRFLNKPENRKALAAAKEHLSEAVKQVW